MRHPKKTVDYFPHHTNHKKTIFILESKFGNDGYAFWFKLLEILGNTENHYLDYNGRNNSDWEFLQAKTHLDENKCNEILEILVKLNAIDRELWSKRIIWSQNFIDGIAVVYRNRRVDIPAKPSFYKGKLRCVDVSTDNKPAVSRESRGEESIVDKEKVNKKKTKLGRDGYEYPERK